MVEDTRVYERLPHMLDDSYIANTWEDENTTYCEVCDEAYNMDYGRECYCCYDCYHVDCECCPECGSSPDYCECCPECGGRPVGMARGWMRECSCDDDEEGDATSAES